ncbi:DUF1403 family protein [Litoreibacter albidus]|uniref:DUF1403 family protein n=1 Tax=Litoreibacter albidus TaxID=670155 RepID=UPI003734FFA9
MTYQPTDISDDQNTLPKLPAWVTSARPKTPEDVAFLSGAVLSHLHLVLEREDVPQSLLRERLALRAAEACVTHQGRPERAGDLRDAVAFLHPGDSPGPSGEIALSWQRAVARPVSVDALQGALLDVGPERIATWLDAYDQCGAGHVGAASRAAAVLQTVLEERPRDPSTALLLADAALAQALGWTHVVPLLALGLKRADLRTEGDELRTSVHRALVAAAVEVTREAADLTRRAARLREVAPRLRAKGAEDAVTVFLARDAVAPAALTSLRSDRAARRFCDRLVELGAVRELTGRDTFRLYGL